MSFLASLRTRVATGIGRPSLDGRQPGGYRLTAAAGSTFNPFPGWLAKPAARLWPGGAWGLFIRLDKVAPYAGSHLRCLVENELQTNFYLGPPEERQRGPSSERN
jgi:hypothetical protein